MDWREARAEDAAVLAEMNARLIQDEGSRNAMRVSELEARMRGWLASGEYRAVLFESAGRVVAYALYRAEANAIHLRQLFVERAERRQGVGRASLEVLRREVWPPQARVTVDVLAANPAGAAFWRSLGFQEYALTLELPSSD